MEMEEQNSQTSLQEQPGSLDQEQINLNKHEKSESQKKLQETKSTNLKIDEQEKQNSTKNEELVPSTVKQTILKIEKAKQAEYEHQ